jgi:hypothetical protein
MSFTPVAGRGQRRPKQPGRRTRLFQVTDAAVEIEGGLGRLDIEFIYELLRQTHWALDRTRDVFERAIKHPLCFGAYVRKRQVGFARVVTGQAIFGYHCRTEFLAKFLAFLGLRWLE